MARYLPSESSTNLSLNPSPEAAAALEVFRKEHLDEFRYYSSLLLRLIDEFDIEVDLDFLPDDEQNESINEKNCPTLDNSKTVE